MGTAIKSVQKGKMPTLEMTAVVAASLGALASGVAAIASVLTLRSQGHANRRDEGRTLATTLFGEWRSVGQRTGRHLLETELPQHDPSHGVQGSPPDLREHFVEVGDGAPVSSYTVARELG